MTRHIASLSSACTSRLPGWDMAEEGPEVDFKLTCFVAESSRHFGGTKLGTGGLARAYGGAARQCLQEALRCTVTPTVLLLLEVQATFCHHHAGL